MAAVIVGSMVLSVAIALGTTFFKNRFTPDECKSGLVNYIMGLCAITEAPSPAPRPIRYTSHPAVCQYHGGIPLRRHHRFQR